MANLLLIEDDDAQRYVAAFALRKCGHEVHEAPDGPTGLELARLYKPDAIVCDVMMPGMTGYEVVTALRADPALAPIPVVLLTAMSDRSHMRQGMTAGADDYLTKPYRPQELIEAVAAVLAKRQVQEQAFVESLSDRVKVALDEQREELGRRYEQQLAREVNARWARSQAAGDLDYPDAVLLLADLLGRERARVLADVALARQTQQAARDTLYLFGAAHVLPYGDYVMAIFPQDRATPTAPMEARALRAAFALLKTAPRERGMNLSLHRGHVALVPMHDGLHGDAGHALVPGKALSEAAALRAAGEAAGWRITASAGVAATLGEEADLGRRATAEGGIEAVELRPLPRA